MVLVSSSWRRVMGAGGVGVCGIVARLGLESTGDRVEPDWASALRAMESDFYITATAGIRYTFTHMVAVRVTDPLDNALDILCQLAIIVPNKNNKMKTDDKRRQELFIPTTATTSTALHHASCSIYQHIHKALQQCM